jgi:hypothetical protein
MNKEFLPKLIETIEALHPYNGLARLSYHDQGCYCVIGHALRQLGASNDDLRDIENKSVSTLWHNENPLLASLVSESGVPAWAWGHAQVLNDDTQLTTFSNRDRVVSYLKGHARSPQK